MQIQVNNVSVDYTSPEGGILPALDSVTCRIESGEFVCVLGPSGCGKSTLIRVIAGLQPPTTGTVHLNNHLVNEPTSQVGLMFQDANLMPWRTVQENIALPLELAGVLKKARFQAVEKLLPVLELEDFPRAYPGELSGGMAQRVALGRVLIQEPQILLLDEPFGALDALTREHISMDLLRIWSHSQQTVLMVTHSIHEAVLLSDRVLVMSQRPGTMIADIPIDLPRPRQLEMVYTDNFAKLAKQARQAIDNT